MQSFVDDETPVLRPGIYKVRGASHLGGIFESSVSGFTAHYGEGWEVVRLYDKTGSFFRCVNVAVFSRRYLYDRLGPLR